MTRHRYNLVLSLGAVIAVERLLPFPSNHPLLRLIAIERPGVFAALSWGYLALTASTTFLALSVLTSIVYIAARGRGSVRYRPLPPYPKLEQRREPFLVLGERHHATKEGRAPEPAWLTIPERGLYTGIAVIGAIGSGKTSACVHPYADQLLGYKADTPEERIGGLVLEVKGDFCEQVRAILHRHGRDDDYVEVSLTSGYRYNPLHNDLDAYAVAFGIATLITNVFGRGNEPFWHQASTNLMKFVILLHRVLDDYVTLFQVYEHVINPEKLRARIAEARRRFAGDPRQIVVSKDLHARSEALSEWEWHEDATRLRTWAPWSAELEQTLARERIACETRVPPMTGTEVEKRAQLEAIERWFADDWMQIEPKLRTTIVSNVSVVLSLFDDNPRVKHAFCPPKTLYQGDARRDAPDAAGVALPPIADLIEQGKVVALNMPAAMNPVLARVLGTLLKLDFQRAVLNRIPATSAEPQRRRPVLFLCDEYQAFATTGEREPSGDEKFFSLARQARCMPIVATQSISSLRSALPGESWRTLLQGLRTKIFLTLSDDFSARVAADLCGRAERLRPSYTLTEAGQDANVSLLTARPAASRATVSASKNYSLQFDYVFQPKTFAELPNAQAIVLAYDGTNPQPPTYCYLKPHYLDVQKSYFDHIFDHAGAGDL
jgi:hypothetical protein